MSTSKVEIFILPPDKVSSYWYLEIMSPDGTVYKKSKKPYTLLAYAQDWVESRNMSLGVINTHAHFESSDANNSISSNQQS